MKTYETGFAPFIPRKQPEEIRRETPKVGDLRTFIPSAFDAEHTMSVQSVRQDAPVTVTGTVIEVHEEHRWCRVRYELPNGEAAHECFKF